MADVRLDGVSTEQMMLMADALALAGFVPGARNLYATALASEADPKLRYRLRLRAGLLLHPTPRTPDLMRLLKQLEGQYAQVFVGSGIATWQKTQPFLDDERFMTLEEKHAHLLPLPNWHWNLQTVLWAVQKTANVAGDLVELGVFRGHTTQFIADYIEFQTSSKRWFLYDTFEGIPEDQLNQGWGAVNEAVYKDTYSYEEVVERFAPFPNIEVIRGRVPEILRESCPEQISFLHIDLNNMPAEIAALDLLIDRLSPGAVLILDDYCWASARAQFEAEHRWFSERGLHVLPLPTGQGVFIKD
jgi:O-methyltransferase